MPDRRTNGFVFTRSHVESSLWTGNNTNNITAVEMSKAEYKSLLFRISKRLDEINALEHILFICEEKLDRQADQDIHDTQPRSQGLSSPHPKGMKDFYKIHESHSGLLVYRRIMPKIVRRMNSWPRSEALRATMKFC